jgi:signal transduction histidine kinase
VTWRLSPSPVECPLDENEARRAVANVAQNALEALGPAGSVEIATEARGGAAVVRVTDDGCGIPRERLDKVFEEFYTTKPQGTGLGMGIVRKVMERHRGTVTISGREGGGTIVELTFPLERRP